MKKLSFALTVATLLCMAKVGLAQDPHRQDTVIKEDGSKFYLELDRSVQPTTGKTFEVKIHAVPGAHWHIYSAKMSPDVGVTPLSVSIPTKLLPYFQITGIEEKGKIISHYDSNFSAATKFFVKPFDEIVTIKVRKNSKSPVPFSLFVRYTTCNEGTQCMPPRSFQVPMIALGGKPIDLSITEGTPDTSSSNLASNDTVAHSTATGSQKDTSAKVASVTSSSDTSKPVDFNWKYLIEALLAGFGALVTPCVYPMVPITVSFFTKRNAGSRKEAIKDATLYGLGIVLTFVVLGFVLSLLFRNGISGFAAHPATNISVAVLFIAFSLNLFGLYEIGLPSSWLSRLNKSAQQSKSRVRSVMLMGFVFSLTSFTCSVPFVGGAFFDFTHGSLLTPVIGMTVFASVFALPFVILAIVPSLVKQMPRSGGWLNNVKVFLGFLEIAIAIRYFSNADMVLQWGFFTRDLVLAAWVAITIITTLYLLGRFHLSHDTPLEHVGPIRAVIAVLVLSVGVYLYTGFHGKPLGRIDAFLPDDDAFSGQTASLSISPSKAIDTSNKTAATSANPEAWIPNYAAALAEAKRTGKNIFIDFTGYTCTNCRAMERTVFSRPDVKELFHNFVLTRLYTDNGTPLNDSNRDMEEQRFKTIALPYYVIVSPDDKQLATFPGYSPDAEAFKTFLRLDSKKNTETVAMVGK